MARTAAPEPEASRTAYTAASPVPAADSAARPPTGASSSTAPRGKRAAAQRGAQPPVSQRDVRADGEHQHHEAHVAEEPAPWDPPGRPRRVGAPDDHAREDLADHNRNEHPAPAPSSGPARPASTINASTPKVT